MRAFNFTAPAEIYVVNGGLGRRQQLTYRRFASAASAVRYVIEELAPSRRNGAVMEVNEKRHYYREIHALYERSDYPLRRAAGKVKHGNEAKLPV